MINEKPYLIRIGVNINGINNIETPPEGITTYNVIWDRDGLVKKLESPYDFVFKKYSLGDAFKQVELIEELNPGLVNTITITQ
jgi:hypothetical protein